MSHTHKIFQLRSQLNACVLGQEKLIDMVLIGVFAQGHILLESVPGLAKTTLAKALAKSLELNFKRIQFTPDLLPSDIIGAQIYSPKDNDLQTRFGPIFTNILLADEINRAPAKVQSALLEAMQEHQVTIDRTGDFSKYATLSFEGSGVPFTTVKDGGTYTFRFKKTDNSQKVSGIVVDGSAGKATFTSAGDIYTVTVPNIKSDITITVKFESVQPVLTSIYANPNTITYYVGQWFEKDDLTIYAVYDDDNNTAKRVTNFTVENAPSSFEDFTEEEEFDVTVKYTEANVTKETTVHIIVEEPVVDHMSLYMPANATLTRKLNDRIFEEYKFTNLFAPYQDLKFEP